MITPTRDTDGAILRLCDHPILPRVGGGSELANAARAEHDVLRARLAASEARVAELQDRVTAAAEVLQAARRRNEEIEKREVESQRRRIERAEWLIDEWHATHMQAPPDEVIEAVKEALTSDPKRSP